MKVEHVRMRLAHEVINTELVDMELIELKFIFDRCECAFNLWMDDVTEVCSSPS